MDELQTGVKLALAVFHSRRFLSSQAKLRSTIQRCGMTMKVCSSLRLATCTVMCSPSILLTSCAKSLPT